MTYSHQKIEKKWQAQWLKLKLFHPNLEDTTKPKLYLLDMFPYPSGKGLHVGHLRGYLATDILTRMKRMQGYNVLHPIGFDSFGLPAEQYALKTGNNPQIFTEQNINNFLTQLQNFGFAYDYQRVVMTHHPHYYKWTQWIFLQFLKAGLAEERMIEINFCPQLNTVLANEETIIENNKMVSERGHYPVFRTKQKQWVLKITNYAAKLLAGLEDKQLFWPSAIIRAQKNWIGVKEGYLLTLPFFQKENHSLSLFVNELESFKIAKFIVIAINNEKFDHLLSSAILNQLKQLREKEREKPLLFKTQTKQVTGLLTNLKIVNPLSPSHFLPVCYGDYIDGDFATGIKLGIPKSWTKITATGEERHFKSEKDLLFALNYQLVDPTTLAWKNYQREKSVFDKKNSTIKLQMVANNSSIKIKKATFYNLKDWVFARQRYWGEPFPITHQNGKVLPLSEEELPLLLPKVEKTFFLQKHNLVPLSTIKSWTAAGYDISTMPQWAGSCWYFLAYLLKKEDGSFWPLNSQKAKQILNKWMPVDLYVGGYEHAVTHLIYARFWSFFLKEIGCLQAPEPFQKLLNQGLILAKDGSKMSKSKDNVIDPNDYLVSHGADAIRLHINFLGPFKQKVAWDEKNLDGMRKWLARVYRLFFDHPNFFTKELTPQLDYIFAKTVQEVTTNLENTNFNSAIAHLMTFINFCYKVKKINLNYFEGFLKLLYPFCPHLAEEIWASLGKKKLLIYSSWPTFQKEHLLLKKCFIALQINGKTKKVLSFISSPPKERLIALSKKNLTKQLEEKKIQKIIFVANAIVNFVVK